MIDELVGFGQDILQRLENLLTLSYAQMVALPDSQLVRIEEVDAWLDRVAAHIQAEWTADEAARLERRRQRFREDIERQRGTEIDRAFRFTKDVVGLLAELQKRSQIQSTKESTVVQTSVLFVAADPSDAARLRLGEEFREIQSELERGRLRDQFVLELPQLATRARDLSGALLNYRPTVVHFSGHGTEAGALVLEDAVGRAQPAPPEAVAGLFEVLAGTVKCVVLNACFSEVQAMAIANHVPHVIGMNNSVSDLAAIAFSVGFYQAIGAGATYQVAYRMGCLQIDLRGIGEGLKPVYMSDSSGD